MAISSSKQTASRFSLISRLNRYVFIALYALLLSACTESLTGVDPDPEEPDPVVEMETVYDLTLKTHFINITGSCDATFGQPTSGEFQYRYEISGGGKTFELESQNYDSRFGVVHNRVAGQQINFQDESYSWSRMSSPEDISIKLFGTEWDGAIRDSRMSNRNGSRTVPFKLGSTTRTITIGANKECQIYLAYTAEWREREVPK